MSICGLIMQQLSRNKFVSPTTAGTEEAARLLVFICGGLVSVAEMVKEAEEGLK
jgi:iron complex transport system permease protein